MFRFSLCSAKRKVFIKTMNVYLFEMKKSIKTILIWSFSAVGFLIMYNAFYPSLSAETGFMDAIMANYPEEMLKAMGMTGLSLSTVLGYFSFIMTFVYLMLAIQSANYGFSILSEEERDLTADFLMSKPVSRTHIFLSKFFAAFTGLIITNIFVWGGSFLSIELFRDGNNYDLKTFIMILSVVILFQLFFLSIGMIISVSLKKIKSVLPYSMGLSFGLYMIGALRGIIGGDLLGIFTPFYHFESAYIAKNTAYNMPMVIISCAIIIVSLIGSYVLYLKRNIHSL